MNDDDLPVLTQVLRIGTVRRAATDERFLIGPNDARVADTPPPAEPLAIGTHWQQAIEACAEPTESGATDGGADAHAAADEPSGHHGGATAMHAPDALWLPHDHDDGATARRATLDMPALNTPAPPVAADPPENPAVLARRLRDAVVDELRMRIDTDLDARIAQALHAEVETVLARLQQNLRAHLSDALRDVVAKAVDDTIAGRRNGEAPVA